MIEDLLAVAAPYVGLAAAYYVLVLYPVMWFRARYRLHIHRRRRVHA